MNTFEIHKAPLNNAFTGINTATLGAAVGKLTQNGMRLYLYLASNKEGMAWTVNPAVYADWLGMDYTTANGKRNVNKAIAAGIDELIKREYLIKQDKEKYAFMEQGVPKNADLNNQEQVVPKIIKNDTNVQKQEQAVPKVYKSVKLLNQEQVVPENNKLIAAEQEQVVPKNNKSEEQVVPEDIIYSANFRF